MPGITGWSSFYGIVGASAGALIGLQFVVMTLVTQKTIPTVEEDAGAAFTTPTIVHFSSALLLSAAMSAPWPEVKALAIFIGAFGLIGVIYGILTIKRMRTQTMYVPEFVDWLWHAILPVSAYLTLLLGAAGLSFGLPEIDFAIAGVALLLLFIGIHNAWDTVTYHVFVKSTESQHSEHQDKSSGEQ